LATNRAATNFSSAGIALAAILIATTPARCFSGSDDPDSYSEIEKDGLKQAYLEALSVAGESSTGKLVHYRQDTGGVDHSTRIIVHAVQDRGLPRGEEYPTYVFKTVGGMAQPRFVFKTHAGTRIYASDSDGKAGCLISAKKGYSDICLADVQGNIAPDLPALRKDFWSDLIKLFGL